MRNLKFCPNLTFLFKEYEVLERYDAAKAYGFLGVELAFPYEIPVEQIAHKREQTGLEQILINSYPGNKSGDFGLAALPGREEDFAQSLKTTLEYADALNCKKIHFMSGKLPGQENSSEVLKTLEKNLLYALPHLIQRDIVGLIEPINNSTLPDYLLSDFDSALSTIKSIHSENIRLQLDLFHLQQIHGNLTKRIKDLLPFTGHIQIAQVPFRNEPYLSGELNYKYIFDLLEMENYTGWIGLEYNPLNGTESGLNEFMEYFNCNLGHVVWQE